MMNRVNARQADHLVELRKNDHRVIGKMLEVLNTRRCANEDEYYLSASLVTPRSVSKRRGSKH